MIHESVNPSHLFFSLISYLGLAGYVPVLLRNFFYLNLRNKVNRFYKL
jgi:hypothetical protein